MENQKSTHELLYAHLWRHTKEQSTQGLCLAEFIDNSISSYLKSTSDESEISNISGCTVKIIIDEQDPKNIKIRVSDNAGGMNAKELDEAAHEYHNSFGKSTNQINQYGIGMKFAIFWFGRNGKIWSKRKNEPEFFLDYEANLHVGEDSVVTSIEESHDDVIDGHGTQIEIENVYDENSNNRRLLTAKGGARERLEDVFDTLRFRFRDYVMKGLFIKFYKITKDNPIEEFIEEISPNTIAKTMIFETKSFTLERSCGIENFNSATDDELAELDSKKNFFKDLKMQPEIHECQDYKKLISLIDNNKPLVIDEVVKFNGHDLKVNLCFLAEASNKYFGVGVKHCHRFIYHLPNKKTPGLRLGTMFFTDNDRYKDGIDRWLYAEVDLTDTKKYGVEPDKNKANLIWPDDRAKNWSNEFEKLITKYENFIRLILQKITNTSRDDRKKRLKQAHESGSVSANFNLDVNGSYICDVSNGDDLSRHYNIGEAKILIKENKKLNELFSWTETAKNCYELQYDPEHDVMNLKFLDFNFLKLIGLISLISMGKFETNESIIDVINNIAKGSSLE